MSQPLPDLRAGQRWRLPTGEEVVINAISDDQVDGTLMVHGTVAVWVKNRYALAA